MTAIAPPAPTAPRRSAGRHVAVWLGAAVAVLGALLAIAGGAVLAAFGTDGRLSTGHHDFSTPTRALVSEAASIDTAGAPDLLGDTRIAISARAAGGRPVFVGIGRASDVNRYLSGVATDEVTDFDAGPFRSSFRVKRERRAGSAAPGAPGRRPIWVAQSTSRSAAAVDWRVRDGRYRLVVMNADGSPGVATRSAFAVKVPYLPGVAIGVLVAGLLLTAGGVASATLGSRRPRA